MSGKIQYSVPRRTGARGAAAYPERRTENTIMQTLIEVLLFIIQLAWIILLVWVVMSWLVAFGVVNTRNQFVATLYRGLHALVEPVLRPIRRILPNTGPIDLSPLVLVIILFILERLLRNNAADLISAF